jgi:hypothetical protein
VRHWVYPWYHRGKKTKRREKERHRHWGHLKQEMRSFGAKIFGKKLHSIQYYWIISFIRRQYEGI